MKKRNIVEINSENDIKFKGPLSYRAIKIIAWVGVLFIVVSFFLRVIAEFVASDGTEQSLLTIKTNLSLFANMALPCFILSTLFKILGDREALINQIKFFALASALIIVFWLFSYLHYVQRLNNFFESDFFTSLLKIVGSINIFIDLLLFSLIYYFLTYVPKKTFQGKRIYIFRCLVAIPILYEITSIVLKGLNGRGVITIPAYLYSFLNTKSPSLFICFVLCIVYVIHRQKHYNKMGGTHEQFEEYLKTNYNSLFFSIYTSIILLLVFCLDYGCLLILSNTISDGAQLTNVLTSWGIGDDLTLVCLIPVVMLTSYTRMHKNKTIDTLLPLIAIGVIAFVGIEGVFQCLIYMFAS